MPVDPSVFANTRLPPRSPVFLSTYGRANATPAEKRAFVSTLREQVKNRGPEVIEEPDVVTPPGFVCSHCQAEEASAARAAKLAQQKAEDARIVAQAQAADEAASQAEKEAAAERAKQYAEEARAAQMAAEEAAQRAAEQRRAESEAERLEAERRAAEPDTFYATRKRLAEDQRKALEQQIAERRVIREAERAAKSQETPGSAFDASAHDEAELARSLRQSAYISDLARQVQDKRSEQQKRSAEEAERDKMLVDEKLAELEAATIDAERARLASRGMFNSDWDKQIAARREERRAQRDADAKLGSEAAARAEELLRKDNEERAARQREMRQSLREDLMSQEENRRLEEELDRLLDEVVAPRPVIHREGCKCPKCSKCGMRRM